MTEANTGRERSERNISVACLRALLTIRLSGPVPVDNLYRISVFQVESAPGHNPIRFCQAHCNFDDIFMGQPGFNRLSNGPAVAVKNKQARSMVQHIPVHQDGFGKGQHILPFFHQNSAPGIKPAFQDLVGVSDFCNNFSGPVCGADNRVDPFDDPLKCFTGKAVNRKCQGLTLGHPGQFRGGYRCGKIQNPVIDNAEERAARVHKIADIHQSFGNRAMNRRDDRGLFQIPDGFRHPNLFLADPGLGKGCPGFGQLQSGLPVIHFQQNISRSDRIPFLDPHFQNFSRNFTLDQGRCFG